MANSYWDATGVLVLDRVTPVITALFGGMNLDGTYPGEGKAYIADVSDGTSRTWATVLEALHALATENGCTEEFDDGDPNADHTIALAAEALKIDLGGFLIGETDPDDLAELEDLWAVAHALDDGHGLRAIHLEGAWFCDKPRLDAFGGSGTFVGPHATIYTTSHQAQKVGQAVNDALAASDFEKAAQVFAAHFRSALAGIKDARPAQEVATRVGALLTAPSPGAEAATDFTQELLASAERAATATRFMDELLESVETLTGIAEQYGAATLADLFYLHAAMLDEGGFIELMPESAIFMVIKQLPSAAEWRTYISTTYAKEALIKEATRCVDESLSEHDRQDIPDDLASVRVAVWWEPDGGSAARGAVAVWSQSGVTLSDEEATRIAVDIRDEKLRARDLHPAQSTPAPDFVL